jgi:hypothetical protein
MPDQLGRLVLFGAGETAASGRKVFDEIFRRLTTPVRVAILERPAGFNRIPRLWQGGSPTSCGSGSRTILWS